MEQSLILKSELEKAQKLLREGQAQKVIKRLTSILSQIELNNPQYVFQCVSILRELSRAAAALGENDWADLYINQATKYLLDSTIELGYDKTDLFLSVAETLLERQNIPKAIFLAESALSGLADAPDDYDLEDITVALHRYAVIARSSGSWSSAYLALTVALLLLQQVNGLESSVATEAEILTSMACKAAAPLAVGRLGCFLLKRAA